MTGSQQNGIPGPYFSKDIVVGQMALGERTIGFQLSIDDLAFHNDANMAQSASELVVRVSPHLMRT